MPDFSAPTYLITAPNSLILQKMKNSQTGVQKMSAKNQHILEIHNKIPIFHIKQKISRFIVQKNHQTLYNES